MYLSYGNAIEMYLIGVEFSNDQSPAAVWSFLRLLQLEPISTSDSGYP